MKHNIQVFAVLVIIFIQSKQTGNYKNILVRKVNFKTCISFWHVHVEIKQVSLVSMRVSQRKVEDGGY